MAEQLKKGSTLLWYRIDSILGRGGFGITYLATDTNLEKRVAIKEYLPGEIAERKQDSYVIPKTGTDGEMYRWGLTRFIDEARILAKFKHHNIVRVHSVFEENNTAYMIMEYEHGNNLDLMLRTPQFQSEERLVEIFDAIMSGLEQVHAHNIIHRDIKPANIYIREDGSPVLLDFGSARQHVADKSQNMTRILTKGYAPYEQMDDSGNARQGPWTDIYAIGATLYYAISRQLPTDCLSRFTRVIQQQPDPLKPARELETQGQYSPEFLFAIDQALQFDSADRPQNVGEFRHLLRAGLDKRKDAPQKAPLASTPDDPDATVIATPSQQVSFSQPVESEKTRFSEDLTPRAVSSKQTTSEPVVSVGLRGQPTVPPPSKSRLPIFAGAAALVAAIGLGGAYLYLQNSDNQSANNNALTEDDILRLEQQAAQRKQAEAEQKRLEKEQEAAAERRRIEEEQAAKQAEADRMQLENERAEAERVKREQERLAEIERAAREEAEAEKAKREQERLAQERAEAEKARREQERIAQERAEAEKARREQERLAQERIEAERARREQERLAEERERKRLEEEARLQRLAEIERLEKLREEEARRQKALAEAEARAEQERIAAEEKLKQEQARLEELRKAEEAEKARLAKLEAEEQAAARRAEAERLEKERAAAEKLKQEQALAAQKKAEADKVALANNRAQTGSKPTVTRVAKKKPSADVLIEQQKQANESDMQSISRLFNDFRTHLASCDVKTLKSTSNAQKDSASFVSSLCGEYQNMEISIRNFQSNIRRGVASADVTIQKLTSKSGDTVLPSKNWNTLPIKTKKSKEGFWEFVEW